MILDDLKARKLASKLNLSFTGTPGVLLKAKEVGIITAIKPVMLQIQQTTFRFSNKPFTEILENNRRSMITTLRMFDSVKR
ncbi:MAG: hypothetical protein JWQ40_3652 [Segetibacter sp.]|nr:hypothetical protein [Segetibacter sp.]